MANLFDNLPLPVGNGPGTAVDVSAMGKDKTLIVDGDFPNALIAIEISNDGGVSYAPIATFQEGSSKLVVPKAAQWMRTNVSGRSSINPFAATVFVGSDDAGGQFMDLPMPAGNGAGASIDASAFGQFATFVVAGTFPDAVVGIEASDDDTDWVPVCLFANKGGQKNVPQTANFYRVVVSGRQSFNAFTATASVGAINGAGSGGSGSITQIPSLPQPVSAPGFAALAWNPMTNQLAVSINGAAYADLAALPNPLVVTDLQVTGKLTHGAGPIDAPTVAAGAMRVLNPTTVIEVDGTPMPGLLSLQADGQVSIRSSEANVQVNAQTTLDMGTAAGAVTIDAATDVSVLADAGAVNVTASDAVNVTGTGAFGGVTLTDGAATVSVNGGTATGNINITAASAQSLNLTGSGGVSLGTSAGPIQIETTGGGDITVSTTGANLNLTAATAVHVTPFPSVP